MRRRKRQRRRRIEAVFSLCVVLLSCCIIFLIGTRHYEQKEKKEQENYKLTGGNSTNQTAFGNLPIGSKAGDSSVRIGNAGDMILQPDIIEAYGGMESNQHDFSPALETFRAAYESVDFMVVNLEVSLGGDAQPYSGFPRYNVPDEIVSDLKGAGVDLYLLAHNHIYDNGKEGFLRTISVMQQMEAAYTGIRAREEEPAYMIRDLNGIRVGIVNYTYEMESDSERKQINGNVMDKSVESLLNSYKGSDLESFYQEIAQIYQEMRKQGVEFIIAYMHWGNGYELLPNDMQKAIAQKLCNLGTDAVMGTHPHVVQPMDVLTSEDGSHKMLCVYSLGNHWTDQRRENISSRPNGHTEDGLMVNLTVSRKEGIVSITGIEAVPTYVYKNEVPQYYVIPIYNPAETEAQTGLSGIQTEIQTSYDRTVKILGSCVENAKRELGIPME